VEGNKGRGGGEEGERNEEGLRKDDEKERERV